MKKKLLSILLVLCMLVASFAVLASCEKDDKDTKPGKGDPSVDAKKEKIVTLLTADSLKDMVADVMEAAGEVAGADLDPSVLLEDVNVYGAFGGKSVAIKDGGLVADDGTHRFAVTFKDGCALIMRNGVVTQHIPLSFELPDAESLEAMTEEINAAIDMAMSFVPAITVADIEYKDGWFCFTEAYLAKAVKDTIAKQFTVPEGYEPSAEELAAMEAELEAMTGMVDALFASVDVTIGFAIDGEAINGFKVAVDVDDLAALAGAMMPEPAAEGDVSDLMSGEMEISLEAKLSADLSKFAYFDIYADMDVTAEGENMAETFDVRAEYANNALTTTVDIELAVPNGQSFDIAATMVAAHDANNVPTVFTADVDVVVKGMEVSHAEGSYATVPVEAYGVGDVTVTADVLIDLTKLAGSGRVIDADVTLATSNVVIKADVSDDLAALGVTEEMIVASFTEEQKAILLNPETLNGALSADFITENGEGIINVTAGLGMTFGIQVAVNAEDTVALNQAEKDAVEAYVPADHPENEVTLEELMSGAEPAPEVQ